MLTRRLLSLRAKLLVRAFRRHPIKHKFHFNLGLPTLAGQWKGLLSPAGLGADVVAGLTVACVAIPLSLAIALASGVNPEIGLVTAIIGSIAVALLGGTPLAVSGPAAAMAVLIASVVETHGLTGLLVVAFGCGLLQLLTGVLGLGRFVRYIPIPVIEGFTAGIGAIILIGQLPKALGIPNSKNPEPLEVLIHISDSLHHVRPAPLALAALTVAIILLVPKLAKRAPAPLIAVFAGTVIAMMTGFDVLTIGTIPSSLPLPKFPSLPEAGFAPLLSATLSVYAIASLETLLSSSALDKMVKNQRHSPDQELIGQGLGNMAVSLFGGIPITGVIARSMLNVQAGAKTRRAAIFHAFVLVCAVYFLSNWISHIPIAVLSGVLITVALRMLNPKEIVFLWKHSRSDSLVYGITFVTIVFSDLIAGVQMGIVAALIISAIRLNQTRAMVHVSGDAGDTAPCQVALNGPLTFISSSKIEMVRTQIYQAELANGVVFDLKGVTAFDSSGADYAAELILELLDAGVKVVLSGSSHNTRQALRAADHTGRISELFSKLGEEVVEPRDRLLFGVERFRREMRTIYGPLLKKLAVGQNPHTLLITCSDSRINPNLITSTDPGELFIVRNVGNIVPKFGADGLPAEGAAVEFAVDVLGVSDIVVCGHSECGAMKELAAGQIFEGERARQFPSVSKWLSNVRELVARLPKGTTHNELSLENVLYQIENLKTYPSVYKKLAEGKLRIHAWHYNLMNSDIEEWHPETNEFSPIGEPPPPHIGKLQ